MRFRLQRERIVAGPGTVVVVPPGIRHDFANAGDEEALVRVEIRPALKMEQLFETAIALEFARKQSEVKRLRDALSRARTTGLARHAPRLRDPLHPAADGHRRATRDRDSTGGMSLGSASACSAANSRTRRPGTPEEESSQSP
jgi:hypothetical protein